MRKRCGKLWAIPFNR